MQPGEAPAEDGINRVDKTFSLVPENVLGNDASCPRDPTFTINGKSITLEVMTKGCEIIRKYIRPIIILLASFFALNIAAGILRE